MPEYRGRVTGEGLAQGTSELVVGRVLWLLDAIEMTALAYLFSTSSSSALKTDFLVSRYSAKVDSEVSQ